MICAERTGTRNDLKPYRWSSAFEKSLKSGPKREKRN